MILVCIGQHYIINSCYSTAFEAHIWHFDTRRITPNNFLIGILVHFLCTRINISMYIQPGPQMCHIFNGSLVQGDGILVFQLRLPIIYNSAISSHKHTCSDYHNRHWQIIGVNVILLHLICIKLIRKKMQSLCNL